MGMAASQARFLGLTARKTNVEYEGQQINQQRTTLSNQTANYYNQLLGMAVPKPPSVADFTKTVYTFGDGSLTNSITSLIAKNDGSYTVSYLSQWEDDFTPVKAATSIVSSVNGNYMVGSTTLRKLGEIDGVVGALVPNGPTMSQVTYTETLTEQEKNSLKYAYINPVTMENVPLTKAQYESGAYDPALTYMYLLDDSKTGSDAITLVTVNANGEYVKESATNTTTQTTTETTATLVVYNDEYLDSLSATQIEKLQKEEEYYIQLLNQKYPKYDNNDWYVRYVKNSATGTYSPYFYNALDLDGILDSNGNIISNVNCYTMGSETKTNEVKGIENARLEKDTTGRYISISIPNDNGSYTTYALTTNTLTDQDAYDDAMNQYEYDKFQYDKSIQDINSKIEVIQAQDKNLELRLKQLDTEQNAITTEMDAVQKVIEKNTESTFKTFG